MNDITHTGRYQRLINQLPKDNLLRLCFTYTKERSAACDSFAFAAALGFVSSIVSPFVRIQTKNNRDEQTNLFICILGDSTVSGKSDAIRPLLKSGLLREASSIIENFVLVLGNTQDTIQGIIETLIDRMRSQEPAQVTCGEVEISLPQLFQNKTISLVTISTEAAPYFQSTGGTKDNARGKEISAFHRDAYDTNIIDIPLTKAARNKIGFDLDSIKATCTIFLGLTSDEFEEVKGGTSASCGQLPRFMFVGVDGSFKGLPYVDYSETRMTVKREDILIAVEQFASGLDDYPHTVSFNPKSPVVQDLNNKFVEARDLAADVSDTVRRATIRGVVNLHRVAGLIAGCQLENTVSDEILTSLKDIFENEILPFSIEAQSGGSDLEKKILRSILWYHEMNSQEPTAWEIKKKMTVRNSSEFTKALTSLILSGSIIGYINHPGKLGEPSYKEYVNAPKHGTRYVLPDWEAEVKA
ncbi:MAG: hypothetical protein M0P99_09130 [Candidatus Cloacimonetes bacterium]|nr:hypothetical protein [Candidatus Cloacimonadota bacterium]